MILYEGAMRGVPYEILEACTVDGGSWYHELFHIITPLACPTFSTTIIFAITDLFVSSGPILLFSQAGTVPGGNVITTITFLYISFLAMQITKQAASMFII